MELYINSAIVGGMEQNNTKPFWKYVKSRKQENIGVAPLKERGHFINNSRGKAQILIKQFSPVFTREKVNKMPKTHRRVQQNIIFQRSIDHGKFPNDWLSANVSCILKKGDKHAAENYRPVSLTSVPCKLLEHIICGHMMKHLEKHNVLTSLNHGFRSGYSCQTQLVVTIHDILQSFDKGKQVDIRILDFSKAFDTVPHDRLLHKIDQYGIRGQLHTLGPILFLCHINDLPNSVKSSVRKKLFADDLSFASRN